MGVHVSQMCTVASYVLGQKLRGRRRYPLVLMMEPLFRCNLACAGCGKVQYPAHILRRQLTPAQCFAAAAECGAPIVSLPGGEPLIHPQIGEIVAGLMAMKKYVYLCTNALLLEERLAAGVFRPDKRFTFAVHLDGLQEEHDFAVCRAGTHQKALRAIRAAIQRGFRVTTNTTLFAGTAVDHYRRFFDEVMALGVEGVMVSPGYSYQKAPDQEHFLKRRRSAELFRTLFARRPRAWRFNQSPLFLDFLMGHIDFECTPWGNPTYNIFGWQRPCYLFEDGYARSFRELIEETDWNRYGRRSGNEKCMDCLMHCGFEPSSVDYTFGSLKGFARTAWSALTDRSLGRPEKPLVVPANRKRRVAPPVAPTLPSAASPPQTTGPPRDWDQRSGSLSDLDTAIAKALDFRGDVTIATRDGQTVVGYVFNRGAPDAGEPYLECLVRESPEPRRIRRADIAALGFTGADAAAGRSWDEWVKRHQERQRAKAEGRDVGDIEPQLMPLDD